jgi:hypothetical protein
MIRGMLGVAALAAGSVSLLPSAPAPRAAAAAPQAAALVLPAGLDSYATRHAKITHAQRADLLAGKPVTGVLEADPSKEVAIFGAVWVKAPIARYVEAVKDIEQFEKGGSFLVTKRISTPPRLEDFAQLRLPPDDVADLKTCRVGACELKLSEGSLLRLRREIDWSKPDPGRQVDALARDLALNYVNGYLEGGNARLAAYRDSSRPTFVGHEFQSMVDRMPSLNEYVPEMKRYLIGFPRETLPNATSILYWQEAKFGLKPTIRINHLVVAESPQRVVIASKMLYASHYFWTAIELRVLEPDAARGGFWFASVNRSRSDGLSGFVGSLIRGKVRGEAEKGMLAALTITKAKMEGR